jgi:hypothetical protein
VCRPVDVLTEASIDIDISVLVSSLNTSGSFIVHIEGVAKAKRERGPRVVAGTSHQQTLPQSIRTPQIAMAGDAGAS